MNDPTLLPADLLLPVLVVVSLIVQVRGRARVRLRSPINRRRLIAALATGLIAVLPTARPVAQAQTTPPAASGEVSVTDTGLQPTSLTLATGGSIHWTNNSSKSQTILADDGLFDSGSLPPGAGFSIALSIA